MSAVTNIDPAWLMSRCISCGSDRSILVSPAELAATEREHFITMRRELGLDELMKQVVLACLYCDHIALYDPQVVLEAVVTNDPSRRF